MWEALNALNAVLWHPIVLYVVLAVGVLFTVWSGCCQYHALTHGVAVTLGKYDDKNDPGAINHFQALSAALSGTVGLGNIGGVALAISLGGPGAVFWMWIVGLAGMALKTAEVAMAMLYRNTDDPDNPRGGSMWVASLGFAKVGWEGVGNYVGAVFCICLLIGGITGANMFQAWNVAEITAAYFPMPRWLVGVILTVLVGLVIVGGIKRIGAVAAGLVPFMCVVYSLACVYVLALEWAAIPAMLKLIVVSAFQPCDAHGAFLGGTAGYAFLWGMKRALFSNEAGQGTSPIAHCAAKTDQPVREGIVAGLEPFIDTIVVCTMTTLVVLLSGAWNRGPEAALSEMPKVIASGASGQWSLENVNLPPKTSQSRAISGDWRENDPVFVLVKATRDENTGREFHRLRGVVTQGDAEYLGIVWQDIQSDVEPTIVAEEGGGVGLYREFSGSALTGHAFDRVAPGMGKWIVTFASWLFAVATIISWSYYCEQCVVFLAGQRWVLPYRLGYCLLTLLSCLEFIKSDAQLDTLTTLGTGVMLWANIPIMLVFGRETMRAYHGYLRNFRAGNFRGHAYPNIIDVVDGKDVE